MFCWPRNNKVVPSPPRTYASYAQTNPLPETKNAGVQCDLRKPRQYVPVDYVEWEPKSATCPIKQGIIGDAVTLGSAGSVYEAGALKEWLTTQGITQHQMVCPHCTKLVKDPYTGVITKSAVIPVHIMTRMLDEGREEMKRLYDERESIKLEFCDQADQIQHLRHRVSDLEDVAGHFAGVLDYYIRGGKVCTFDE